MDAKLGDVQYIEKAGIRYPMHGSSQGDGLNIFTNWDWNDIPELGYSGARPGRIFGNSYVSVVGWDATDCPDAFAVLSYSQSTDPASPHYADSTELYSQAGWIDLPYCASDIEAQELRRETVEQ